LLAFLSACIVTKDSPAPGCARSIGLPISGGCFGKTVILGNGAKLALLNHQTGFLSANSR
jgi:hypothetical protein